MANLQKRHFALLLFLFTIIPVGITRAQTPESNETQPTPSQSLQPAPASTDPAKPSLERQFLKNILRDQKAIWTSPFHLHKSDSRWVVPVLAGTAALILTDDETAENLSNNATWRSISSNVSRLGIHYTDAGIAGAFYLVGRLTHNERARETGILSGEALVDGLIVGQALKLITQRPRPKEDNGHGRFFRGGSAFPSGHAVNIWAVATVVASEYHKNRLVQIGAYSLASLVSMSRFTGRNHFLSDVFVGSAIGFGIGRYVYRHHHDVTLDASDKTPRFNFSPHFRPSTLGHAAEYGLVVGYNLGH